MLGEMGRMNSISNKGKLITASSNVPLEALSLDFDGLSSIDEN